MSATIPVKRSELEALQRMLNDALERLVRKEPDTLGALVSVQGSVLGICSFFPPENSLGDGTGTVSTKADSGIDPEISSLRERVRGLEEALKVAEPYVELLHSLTPNDGQSRPLVWKVVKQIRAALLPLPEGGIGKAAQSQPLTDAGPYPRSPEPPFSDGKED